MLLKPRPLAITGFLSNLFFTDHEASAMLERSTLKWMVENLGHAI